MTKCRACNAEIIFLLTKNEKRIPINGDTYSAGETRFDPAKHTSHFATCPKAAQFRKGKKS